MHIPLLRLVLFMAVLAAPVAAQNAPPARSCTNADIRRFIAKVAKTFEGVSFSLFEPGRQVTCSKRALDMPMNADFWMSLNCDQKAETYNFIFLNWATIIGSQEQVTLRSPSGIEWARHSFWSGDPTVRGCS
jgi:hypothetical protein